MSSEHAIISALVALLGFATGYWLTGYLTKYRRMRMRRWIACKFGRHVPGPVKPAVGGRNVQRCEWCDRVVHEYQITPGRAEKERDVIRRIY